MAMVGVDSGSLYRLTHSLCRLAWSWVGGRLAPFYILAFIKWTGWTLAEPLLIVLDIIIIIIIIKNIMPPPACLV